MLNYVWAALMALAVICGIVTGRIADVTGAIFSGGGEAVELWLTLLGMMVLWSGLTEIMQASGLSHRLGKLLSPVIRLLFPELKGQPKACGAIAMNLSANVLGLGNAATPLGLKAMAELHRLQGGGTVAGNSMVTFVVLNSVSVQLLPTGVAMLRAKYGSADPMDILAAVWFASLLAAMVGVTLARALSRGRKSLG